MSETDKSGAECTCYKKQGGAGGGGVEILQTYICPKSHIKFHVSGLSSRETNVSLETCF